MVSGVLRVSGALGGPRGLPGPGVPRLSELLELLGVPGMGPGSSPLTPVPALSPADHDPNLVLLALLPALAVGALLAGGVSYGVYYRKKKIREYRLLQRQKQLEMDSPQPPGSSKQTAALNGSAQQA